MNLMNIDSRKLVAFPIDNVKVGDTIHSKGKTISCWGSTWIVEKITPCQVHCVLDSLFFPVFEHTAFGRIAKGEDKDSLTYLKESEAIRKGKSRVKFWKNGKQVGGDGSNHHVIVIK